MHWYVYAQNQAYGPYSDAQMQAFVVEGRVNAASLIANTPESGYFAASEYEAYGLWSGTVSPQIAVNGAHQYAPIQQAAPQPVMQPVIQPVIHPPEQASEQASEQVNTQAHPNPVANLATYPAPYQTSGGHVHTPEPIHEPTPKPTNASTVGEKSTVYLVMAEIHSNGEIAFLKALQNFANPQRIGDAVWLVRSSHSAEQLRNTLSQTLNQQDRLFIMVSDIAKPAWFNIGADLDHRIRELWDEDGI